MFPPLPEGTNSRVPSRPLLNDQTAALVVDPHVLAVGCNSDSALIDRIGQHVHISRLLHNHVDRAPLDPPPAGPHPFTLPVQRAHHSLRPRAPAGRRYLPSSHCTTGTMPNNAAAIAAQPAILARRWVSFASRARRSASTRCCASSWPCRSISARC